ncbi:serine hydrolase domain-containing protein [Nitriliruptor alkaliphilus]|uniref:serine hydrolase domain-containing protein n=1 Tax=Nitriliruptor alkaliphilus TaxID=427918 RepID=UPI00069675D5|nr:serine hydrolase [Nitriliruptor alkaliphilus]
MSRGRMVLLSLVVLLAALLGGAAWYLRPIAPIATGYAAKTVCSAHFVSGRTVDDGLGDLPPNPLVPLLRMSVNPSERTVRTSLLGVWTSTAYATPGLGCTLSDDRPSFSAPTTEVSPPDPGTPWPAGDGPADLPDDVDGAALDAAIATAFAEDDPEGRLRNSRAVVVVRDGALIAERYGDGFAADTPLHGWSMGKSIANAIVGRLVGDGRLDLDDRDLLEEWDGEERADITLDQLLRMTPGLAFDEVYEPDTDATRMLFRPGDTGAYAADQPLVAQPGEHWSYSSGTTNILCDLAQDASGLGTDLAHELVFAPLGMTTATIEPDASGGLICSSFPYATARDWARFGQWFLQDGEWDGAQLLPSGWVEYSTTPVEIADPGTPYGAQWWLNAGPGGQLRMPSVPADAYWASGNEGQQVVVIPSEGLVVVRLGFSGSFSGVEWGLEPLLAGIIDATS